MIQNYNGFKYYMYFVVNILRNVKTDINCHKILIKTRLNKSYLLVLYNIY